MSTNLKIHLPPTLTIPRLTKAQAMKLKLMMELAEEESQLNSRVKKLKDQRKEISQEMEQVYGNAKFMRLSAREIVEKVETPVHQPPRPACDYTIVKWSKVSG